MPELTKVTVGQFCRELVCGLEPIQDLLTSWNLTEEDYRDLRSNEWFQKELKAAVNEVRDMGPDSTFIVRCKVLSEMFLENIVGMMSDKMTPPEVKAGLFKQITDLARLQPPKTQAQMGSSAPLVSFTFGDGIPGMPRTLTIDAPVPVQVTDERPADSP